MEAAAQQEEEAMSSDQLTALDANGNELDGVSLADLNMTAEEFTDRLRPFHPPPVPVPYHERSRKVCLFP